MKTPEVFKRFLADLKRKEFIPLKILYFMIYGGLYSLLPFLSIQARSLGIKVEEIGFISGVLPFLGIFCSAAAGMIADKIGNFKLFLSLSIAASGLTALAFLAIPVGRITYQLPDVLPLSLKCASQGEASVELDPPYQCDYIQSETFNANVTECHLVCFPERETILLLPQKLEENWCSITPECSGIDNTSFVAGGSHSDEESKLVNQRFARENYIPIQLEVIETQNLSEIRINKGFCPDLTQIRLNTTAYSIGVDNSGIPGEICWLECEVETDRIKMCSNEITVEEKDVVLTLVIYIICVLLQQVFLISSIPLFEGAAIAILKEREGDIGLQRLYSNFGKLALTPLSGLLIDNFSSEGKAEFKPAIYMFCTINIVNAVCIAFVDLRFKKPANNVTKEFIKLLYSFEISAFLFVSLVAGVTTGVIDAFLFWLLEDMGANKSLMGITITVGASFGIPMLIFASSITNKIGHVNTLSLGLFFFVIRLLGYSLITEPWWAMFFEAMECFTTSLFGVAHASYTASLSTPSTIISLQGLSVGLMHSLGRGIGSMMGGFMAGGVGLRNTYRIMAAVCGCVATGYVLLNYLFFRKNEEERKMIIENKKIIKLSERRTENDDVTKLDNIRSIENDNGNKECCHKDRVTTSSNENGV